MNNRTARKRTSDAEVRRYAAQTLGFLRAAQAKSKLLGVLSADSSQDDPDRIAALIAFPLSLLPDPFGQILPFAGTSSTRSLQ